MEEEKFECKINLQKGVDLIGLDIYVMAFTFHHFPSTCNRSINSNRNSIFMTVATVDINTFRFRL